MFYFILLIVVFLVLIWNLPVIEAQLTHESTNYSMAMTGNWWKMYNLTIIDKSYPITYQITGGKLNDITSEKDNTTLSVNISSTSNGTLIIELPRNLIDSKKQGTNTDEEYAIFEDSQYNIAVDEITKNATIRTLAIDFDKGSSEIQIVGSEIVPLVRIRAGGVNEAPSANAGIDQIVNESKIVRLNGTASRDPDSNITSYLWRQTAGEVNVTLINANTTNPTFTSTSVSNDTVLEFELMVMDNDGTNDTDRTNVTIKNVINRPPVADNQTVLTDEDREEKLIMLAANDTEGDTLSYSIVSNPVHGTLTRFNAATGNATYTPSTNYNGSDSFTFKANDGTTDSTPATVSITVNPVNDGPVANIDTANINEDIARPIPVLDNDTDIDGDSLAVSRILSEPFKGNATINPNGTITYLPTANFFGTDSFSYEISDGQEGGTAEAVVAVTINPVNDLPVANNDNTITNEDTSVNINVLLNDIEIDGDSLNITGVARARNGTAIVNASNNMITYTPTADFFGTDTFDYFISDGNNGIASAKVTVIVSPINDKPIAVDDKAATNVGISINIDVLANDTDTEGNVLTVMSHTTNPSNGIAIVNETTNTITYTPMQNFTGVDAFEYAIFDGNEGGNDNGTVKVTVKEVLEAIREFAPSDSGFGVDPDTRTFLTVSFEGPSSIQEDDHAFIRILGSLAASNGTGIKDQIISVKFYNKDNEVFSYQDEPPTDDFGHYEFMVKNGDVNLDKGTYIAFANATADIYKNKLNATKELVVEARPPSIPAEVWAGVSGIIVGFLIPSAVSWINGWRQRKNLSKYRKKIDYIYYTYKGSHKERQRSLDMFDELERKITKQLEKGRISQSQYDILTKRISDLKKVAPED
jgi:VCBS repeat-containing protein